MKKLLLFMAVLFVAHTSYGQIFSWGIKGGVNSSKIDFNDFSVEGETTITVKPDYLPGGPNEADLIDADGIINPAGVDLTVPSVSFEPDSYDFGYHFGAFARIKIAMLFLQPELIFSQTNASINLSPDNFDLSDAVNEVSSTSASIKYNNFDVPVLLGFKMGPAHLVFGPVATFKLKSTLDEEAQKLIDEISEDKGIDIFAVTKNATFGAQVGAGLTIAKKLTVDVRYEFGLSKLGESVSIGEHEFQTDQRVNQFIGSIGWMF